MKKETTEHREVVIAAVVAVITTLMIMMFTAQKSHAYDDTEYKVRAAASFQGVRANIRD